MRPEIKNKNLVSMLFEGLVGFGKSSNGTYLRDILIVASWLVVQMNKNACCIRHVIEKIVAESR
jgi:hypothetical protein